MIKISACLLHNTLTGTQSRSGQISHPYRESNHDLVTGPTKLNRLPYVFCSKHLSLRWTFSELTLEWTATFMHATRSKITDFFLVINQLNAQNTKSLFYNKFIICLYMFRALCAHHQEVKIVLYFNLYHHTCRWPSRAQVERELSLNLCTGRPPTGVMIQVEV